jgi:hypothetical protein
VALPDWILISGIVGTAIASAIGAFRVKPEARKFRDDGAAGLTTSAGAIVAAVEHEMSALRTEAADARRERAEMRQWRDGLEIRLRRHARWDDLMVERARVAGIDVPHPPKLYDDDEEAEAHGSMP